MMWDTLQDKLATTGEVLDGQAANFQVGVAPGGEGAPSNGAADEEEKQCCWGAPILHAQPAA